MSEMSYMEKLLDGVEAAGAGGRVLRQNIRADCGHPPYDCIMMDGFALRGYTSSMTNDRHRRVRLNASQNPAP